MKRIGIIYFLINCVLLFIVLRLFYIQSAKPFNNISTQNRVRTQTEQPFRGRISDVMGNTLATNIPNFRLFVAPNLIKDKQAIATQVASILNIDPNAIQSKITTDKKWLALSTEVTKDQKDKLENLHVPGLGFDAIPKRIYKEASLASHVVGFVGKDDVGNDRGYFGIEGYFNKDLSGLAGRKNSERDGLGRPILFGTQETIEAIQGADITLTLDSVVQQLAKKGLDDAIKKYGAKSGCVIIANPNTLEIHALTCLPDYDQNNFSDYPAELYKDPAVANNYEPGSTFKPLVVAAAVNEHLLNANDVIEEKGPIEIAGFKIKTWDEQYRGTLTVSQVLEKSSNVGMVHIGDKLGHAKLLTYIKKLGFGTKTGIELQDETAIPLRKDSSWGQVEYATATFGQGIAVTAIQMVRAFSSVVNGGYLMTPHIVKKVSYNGSDQVITPEQGEVVFTPETSRAMRDMLHNAVVKAEAQWKIPPGYSFGGKTGTAQIAVHGVYDEHKTVASYIGFVPVDKPQLIGMTILNEPSSSPWGSETAAPLFYSLMGDILAYYNIPPDQPVTQKPTP